MDLERRLAHIESELIARRTRALENLAAWLRANATAEQIQACRRAFQGASLAGDDSLLAQLNGRLPRAILDELKHTFAVAAGGGHS